MPCFNSSGFIGEAVDSVIYQTFTDWELLIIDDGSTDNTYEIAQILATKNNRIKVYKQVNKGVTAARNFGYTKSAVSEYVFFLDSDDVLLPTFLEVLVKRLSESKNIAVVYSDYQEMDKEGNRIESPFKYKRYVPTNFWLRSLPDDVDETPFVSIFCGSNINESTSIFRRSYFDSAGKWNESFNYAEGVELFLKISLLGKIVFVPYELFKYRRHDMQSQAIISDSIKNEYLSRAHKVIKDHCRNNLSSYKKVIASQLFFKTRVRIKYLSGFLKHNLRYNPLRFVKASFVILMLYLQSLVLLFFKKYWI